MRELVVNSKYTFKEKYVRLIASGHVEKTALELLRTPWIDFFEMCAKDPEFRSSIDSARKERADRWIDFIAESVDKEYLTEGENPTPRPPNQNELGRDKLVFEKLKYLAQADNPEKYSGAVKSKVDVSINMSEFKLLTPQESIKVLNNDPFNKLDSIDAESMPIKE